MIVESSLQTDGWHEMVWSPCYQASTTLKSSFSGWAQLMFGAPSTGPNLSNWGWWQGCMPQTCSGSRDPSPTWTSLPRTSTAPSGLPWTGLTSVAFGSMEYQVLEQLKTFKTYILKETKNSQLSPVRQILAHQTEGDDSHRSSGWKNISPTSTRLSRALTDPSDHPCTRLQCVWYMRIPN